MYPICLTFHFSNACHDNQQTTRELCIVTFSDLLFHRDDTKITIRRSLNSKCVFACELEESEDDRHVLFDDINIENVPY